MSLREAEHAYPTNILVAMDQLSQSPHTVHAKATAFVLGKIMIFRKADKSLRGAFLSLHQTLP